MKSKQRLFTLCVVFHVASHMLLATATPGNTSASSGDAFNTATASVENTHETYGNLDGADLNMNKILLLATASMRLKSDTAEDVDDAILQWYYHCEHYVA